MERNRISLFKHQHLTKDDESPMVKSKQRRMGEAAMNLVLCDDNPVFLATLCDRLRAIAAQHDLVFRYEQYLDPVQLLKADLSSAHVVFLDIDMPGLDGIATGRALRKMYPELIIVFVTGYIQYARDGYTVAAFRYLLKNSLDEELPACIRDIEKKRCESQKHIIVRSLERTESVFLQDILYFEGTEQRHVVLHMRQGTMERVGKLSDYEQELLGDGFLRIQRSYLVNMRHIAWIKGFQLCLSTGVFLKISERNCREVTSRYLRWRGQNL